MTDQLKVPDDIAVIIQQKSVELYEQQKRKEEAERRLQEESELRGKTKFDEHIAVALSMVPEWMRIYYDPTLYQPDYYRIDKGWDRVESMPLRFSIPGLALIQFDAKDSTWKCQDAYWDSNTYYDPALDWSRGSDWSSDLEYILFRAQKEMAEYKKFLAEYALKEEKRARRQEENAREEAEREGHEREAEIRSEVERVEEKAEEQTLLDYLRCDPIALAFVKAFVMVYQERSGYIAQIEDLNNQLYSQDEYWSHKAVELRRQADEAQRHADEEYSRASDLEDDLSKANKKIKETQRG